MPTETEITEPEPEPEPEEEEEEQNNVIRRRGTADLINWRRDQVLKLWAKGWTQTKIANELKCDNSTISRDLDSLLKQSQDNIKDHLSETIPRQWTQCLEGLKTIMAEGWNIYDFISNDNTVRITDKTAVLSLIKDCYKHMLDLNADSTIVNQCINFSKRANNKLQPYQVQPQLTQIEQTEEQPLTQEEPAEGEVEEGREEVKQQ